MIIQYYEDFSVPSLLEVLEQMELNPRVHGIMLLVAEGNNYTQKVLNPLLRSIDKPIFGGIFPGLLYNKTKHDTGFILAGVEEPIALSLIEELGDMPTDLEFSALGATELFKDSKTIFVLVDGFAKRISSLVQSLFTIFGLDYNYIGGGAGSLSLEQKPCIISNKGLLMDAAVLVGIETASGIGVKHGWTSISGPFEVTAVKGNVIAELDYKPAFEVYKEVVEQHSHRKFNGENFFDLAKAYPFGISSFGAEEIVRDPISIGEDNSIVCVGEIEEGAFLDIMHGDRDSLIKAAGEAIEQALHNPNATASEFTFFIDCISRVLFLEEDFKLELDQVNRKVDLPVFGALTIGEIANNGKDYLEFYNKTSVVACF